MRTVKRKLRSQCGASLTFALLIFLVCAVVGSVVLTAGTAASGRMSKIAEMDQRYYSVNSAARLLVGLIDNKAITIIEKEKNNTLEYDYENTQDVPENGIVWDAAKFYVEDLSKNKNPRNNYKMNLSVEGLDDLAVSIDETITSEGVTPFGTMILVIKNSKGSDTYSIILKFSPDMKKTEDKISENETITTWKIAWTIQSIEIVGGNMRVEKAS